jgi:hypothetical protein
METVSTQFGTAATADFEEMTWTFQMPENFKVWAGEFAIVDKKVYDQLLESFTEIISITDRRHTAWYKAKSAINKATE